MNLMQAFNDLVMTTPVDSEFPFIPPCMRCQPIIENTNIQFHDKDMNITYPFQTENTFGILEITIRGEIPITNKHQHLFFTIDASGSMQDRCIDGHTKMKHIIHTLENILLTLHSRQECNVSVHIQSFDSSIHKIIKNNESIHSVDLNTILTKIHNIQPGDSTNIEMALKSAKEQIDRYKQKYPSHEVVHMFLTDGEITSGSHETEYLKTLVPLNCTNLFIGYGLEHDSVLLSSLSDVSIDNEYRFIDALDKAGLVYGEIIHGILYKAISNVTIKAEGCEIYDYKKNTWEKELHVGNLLSEQKKTYHIRSNTLEQVVITIFGKTIVKTRQFETLSDSVVEQEQVTNENMYKKVDLSRYIFRQKTQELLYKARHLSSVKKSFDMSPPLSPFETYRDMDEEQKEMIHLLNEFLEQMTEFMKAHNMETDTIMKMLCDDIYIAYKTFGTSVGNMFSCARQISQGSQSTYTACAFTNNDRQTIYMDDIELFPQSSQQYTPSQTHLSPYQTTGIVNLMREVSDTDISDTVATESIL